MSSGVFPRRGAIRMRRSRLVNPGGSSRWTSRACRSAWTRTSPKRIPGMRVPSLPTRGAVRSRNAWAPRTGSWLMRWTPSRRRFAGKPICRRAARFVSRLDSPKSRVSLIVVSVRSALPSLWYLLDLGVLVVDVQGRDDAVGDDPGAEAARGRVVALADDAPVEDQANLVGAANVEVLVQHLLEEDSPGHRSVEHLGEGELGLQDRQLVPVAGRLIGGGERVGQDLQPLAQQRLDVPRSQACLLYTSDAADDLLCVDLGGRRIIKKKKKNTNYE